jgi:predicted component of type VI protein secretion system
MTNVNYNNIFDLLGKIEWEGGLTSVLDYGLRDIEDYDVPDALKEAWENMVSAYEEFEGYMEDVDAELHKAQNTAEEE